MMLSMQMLADRLAQFSPEVLADDSQCNLSNARLLSESQEFSRSTLYLQHNTASDVMGVNGHDILLLHTGDIDQALNGILDIFDHLNEWSSRMDEAVLSGCELGELLAIAKEELECQLIVADATYYIHEVVGRLGGKEDEERKRWMLEDRSMPLETIIRIDADPKVRKDIPQAYYVHTPELGINPLVCNLFVSGEHRGWLIANRDEGGFTDGERNLLELAKAHVEHWMRVNERQSDNREQTAIFRQAILGEPFDEALAQRALRIFGWRPADEKRVLVANRPDDRDTPLLAVERFLAQSIPHSFLLNIDTRLVLVFNEALSGSMDLYEEELGELMQRSDCLLGIGPTFNEISDLRSCFEAAVLAVRAASGKQRMVSFEQVKLDYAASLLRTQAVADVRHSALGKLGAYDAEHGTQLLETLRCFVLNHGSHVTTYQELFIHRTTLQYRLERIVEITGLDLEDKRTWSHLALSFLL